MGKYKSSRSRRVPNFNRGFEKRQTKLTTGGGVNLVGDDDQRRTGRPQCGKYACFGRVNASHFREERPVYIDKWNGSERCVTGNKMLAIERERTIK